MHKFSIYFLVMFTLSGCVDYKWGNRWEAPEKNGWVNLSRRGFESVSTQTQCNDNSITLSIDKYHGSSIMAPFFIPMLINSHPSQSKMKISIDYESIGDICSEYKKEMFEISLNNKTTSDFTVEYGAKKPWGDFSNICSILLNVPQDEDRVVTFKIKKGILNCELNPLIVYETGYFCVRSTKFGGSGYCGY